MYVGIYICICTMRCVFCAAEFAAFPVIFVTCTRAPCVLFCCALFFGGSARPVAKAGRPPRPPAPSGRLFQRGPARSFPGPPPRPPLGLPPGPVHPRPSSPAQPAPPGLPPPGPVGQWHWKFHCGGLPGLGPLWGSPAGAL